jgi:hypothetical protein
MPTKTTAPVSQKRNANPTGCLVLFGLVFLLVGLGGFFATFLRPLWQIQAAKSWTPITCVINSSQVGSTRDSDGDTTYHVEVEYSFPFNGQTYHGNTYQFGSSGSGDATDKNAIVAKLPPGTRILCYVNPANPNQSVINPTMSGETWFGLFTLIFVAVGAGIMIAGVKMRRAGQGTHGETNWRPKGAVIDYDRQSSVPLSGASSTASDLSPFQARSDVSPYDNSSATRSSNAVGGGPVTLKPRASRVGAFFGLLLVSLFWNGIVSVFLVQLFNKTGSFEILMGLFLIPFVLVGLGLIGATIYQFIAMFGPKVTLTVSQSEVPLGGALNIDWKLNGRQNVTNLQIFLEGREEATYRRGTDTYTDKNTFCVLDVADTMSAVTQGNGTVQIPTGTMHSFEARNNKILWQLVVKGQIPIWPDIKEEYPIVVLPQQKGIAL